MGGREWQWISEERESVKPAAAVVGGSVNDDVVK